MLNPSNIFAFAALALLVVTIIRTRSRIKRMEQNRQNSSMSDSKKYEESYNDAKVVKLVNVCRELEARVQNKACLLEALIEDADKRIVLLENNKTKEKPSVPKNDFNQSMYDRVLKLSNEGEDDQSIAKILHRSEGEVKLLKSLGRHTNTEES